MPDLYRELKTDTMEIVPSVGKNRSVSAGAVKDNYFVKLHFKYSTDAFREWQKYIIFDVTDKNGTPYWFGPDTPTAFNGEDFNIPYMVLSKVQRNTLKYQLLFINPVDAENDASETQIGHSEIDTLMVRAALDHSDKTPVEEPMSVDSVIKWWLDQKLVTVEFKKTQEGQQIGTVLITTRPDSETYKKTVEINLDEIFATDDDVNVLKTVLFGEDRTNDYDISKGGVTDRVDALESVGSELKSRVEILEEKLDTHVSDFELNLDGNKWVLDSDGMIRQAVDSLAIRAAESTRCSWDSLEAWKLDIRLESTKEIYNDEGKFETGRAVFVATPLTDSEGNIQTMYDNIIIKMLLLNIKKESA